MNSNKIVHKLINCCNNRINQNLDRIFDKNDKIDIFDYRRILNDKTSFSYSRNTNNFYGLDSTLKRYSGYKKGIYVATEHGVQIPKAENFLCVSEYKNNYSSVLLTCAAKRAKSLLAYSDKLIIPIGPYIQYAESIYDDEIIAQIKSNLGRTLLIFPQHSCEMGFAKCENKGFIEFVKKIKHEYSFDTVIVCIYFYDFIQGLHIPYEREGWTIVSAGHRQNIHFLDNLKTFITIADHIIYQGYSSSVGYSLAMEKPVLTYPYRHKFTKKSREYQEALLDRNENVTYDTKLGEDIYIELFSNYHNTITNEQLKWAEECISLSIKKTPEEMKDIFIMARELYWDFGGHKEKIIRKYGYDNLES